VSPIIFGASEPVKERTKKGVFETVDLFGEEMPDAFEAPIAKTLEAIERECVHCQRMIVPGDPPLERVKVWLAVGKGANGRLRYAHPNNALVEHQCR